VEAFVPGRRKVGVMDGGDDRPHRGFHGELANWIGKLPTPVASPSPLPTNTGC
jgi:hypothetical protein